MKLIAPSSSGLRRLVAWTAWVALALPACGPESAGRLVALPDALDFGLVSLGTSAERRVRLRNEGRQGVVLTATAPSCACIKVDPNYQRSLMPGDEVELRVNLVAVDVPPGRLEHKFLDVRSDDPDAPVLRVPLRGEIEDRVGIAPRRVVVGPADAAGKSEPRRLRVRTVNGYAATWERTEITNPAWFEVSIEPTTDGSAGFDAVLRIKPDPARRGPVNEHVRIYVSTSKAERPEQRHDLLVTIQGEW